MKGWDKFQHFKDRRPPWIKLYRDLLDDIEWFELDPVAAKALVMIWLIASDDDGNLPESKKLAFRLRVTEQNLTDLLSKLSHWLECSDIRSISERCQDDAPETETETETEKISCHQPMADSGMPICPHQKIISLYADALPELPQPRIWDGAREKNLCSRWRWVLSAKKTSGLRYAEDEAGALDFFRRFFGYVAESDFLTGRDGKWSACNLAWLVKSENFAKVIEGNYQNKAAA